MPAGVWPRETQKFVRRHPEKIERHCRVGKTSPPQIPGREEGLYSLNG